MSVEEILSDYSETLFIYFFLSWSHYDSFEKTTEVSNIRKHWYIFMGKSLLFVRDHWEGNTERYMAVALGTSLVIKP